MISKEYLNDLNNNEQDMKFKLFTKFLENKIDVCK